MRKTKGSLELVFSDRRDSRSKIKEIPHLTTIDLFCGAGGITEGFRKGGSRCLYPNDFMPEAIRTFSYNHPGISADCRSIEKIKPAEIRSKLKINKGDLDVLVGDPPCQGFSINAPERFLTDPRNRLFKDYCIFQSCGPLIPFDVGRSRSEATLVGFYLI
jgi:DNA (cytosine-5)-methyltransferase 1